MDQNERQIIDELFGKIRRVEAEASPRDADAEAQIRQHVEAQPAAPYYMAQAIVAQEQALGTLHSRVQELERQQAERPGGGGFLSGLFGGGQQAERPTGAAQRSAGPTLGRNQRQGRGGFMAGAMQTAVGVAGGMLVASALTDAFSSDEAGAGEAAAADAPPEDGGSAGGGEDPGGMDDLGGGMDDLGGF